MQADIAQITTDGVISIALVIVVIGAVWWQAVYQTKVTLCLEGIQKELKALKSIDRRMMHVERGLESMEEDINNLWAKVDNRPLDQSRRSRFRPLPEEKE